MVYLPPCFLRPAILSEIQSPAIVRQTGKYGASFLVIGAEESAMVIFLTGEFQFRAFRRSEATNWSGLGIENVELEVDVDGAFDVGAGGRVPGLAIRRGDVLALVAITEGPFRRTMEIPILSNLKNNTGGQAVGFPKWRAIVSVGDERRVVWECSVVADDES